MANETLIVTGAEFTISAEHIRDAYASLSSDERLKRIVPGVELYNDMDEDPAWLIQQILSIIGIYSHIVDRDGRHDLTIIPHPTGNRFDRMHVYSTDALLFALEDIARFVQTGSYVLVETSDHDTYKWLVDGLCHIIQCQQLVRWGEPHDLTAEYERKAGA